MSAKYPRDLTVSIRKQLSSRRENPPSLSILTELFETLYFASLKREETEPISCRIAFILRDNPDPKPPPRIVADRWKYFVLSEDLPFNVSNIAKLSKAVDPWGSTLAVDVNSENRLRIWGLIDQSVHYSKFVVKEASVGPEMPGMFQAVIQGVGDIAVYKTYVLLGGLRHESLLEKQSRVFEEGPVHEKLRTSIRIYQQRVADLVSKEAFQARTHWNMSLEDEWVSTLCRILIGIQYYGHGGAVLLSDRRDGLKPKYSLGYPRLAEALTSVGALTIKNTHLQETIFGKYIVPQSEKMPVYLHLDQSVVNANLEAATNELTGCVRFLISLSRVDGLIWLDSSLRLRGFGVEIKVSDDPGRVVKALNTAGTKTSVLNPEQFGMRHRSMMRYCGTNSESVGFVVSQDGDVRAIMNFRNRVVLWENVRLQRILLAKPTKS
jgi:hypothetical protein